MRIFRAIVQDIKEPEDINVLWYWKGKLLYYGENGWEPFHPLYASEIEYSSEEAEEVRSVQDALDKILYVVPKITSFKLNEAGTYENGSVVNSLNFSWSYNKKLIRSQSLYGQDVPTTIRKAVFNNQNISRDTEFILTASDGTNTVSARQSINFVNFMYWGTQKDGEELTKYWSNPSVGGLTVIANKDEYIWIFIPSTCNYTRIWHNNVDSTDDFIKSEVTFETNTGLRIPGNMYVSKGHSLNSVTLKFT